jgi:hypothetical protein
MIRLLIFINCFILLFNCKNNQEVDFRTANKEMRELILPFMSLNDIDLFLVRCRKKIKFFIFCLLNLGCSAAFPEIILHPVSSDWNLSENITNKGRLEKIYNNREFRYLIPYLLTEIEYLQILNDSKNFGLTLYSNMESSSSMKCQNEFFILLENYGDFSTPKIEQLTIQINESNPIKKETFSVIYFYENSIYKTSPLKFDIFLNVRRMSRLKFGKNIADYNDDYDIKVERSLMRFCINSNLKN